MDLHNRHELKRPDDVLIRSIANAGYTTVINFTRKGAELLVATYPQDWLDLYDKRKYIWVDPILVGSVMRDGNRRWSDIRLPDPFGVMKAAAKHGLVYGASFTRFAKAGEYPCMLSVARHDRELTDDEIQTLSDWFDLFVSGFDFTPNLTKKERQILKLLSMGLTVEEAAQRGKVSASAMKNRLASCRAKLGAKTNAEALLRAADKRLL